MARFNKKYIAQLTRLIEEIKEEVKELKATLLILMASKIEEVMSHFLQIFKNKEKNLQLTTSKRIVMGGLRFPKSHRSNGSFKMKSICGKQLKEADQADQEVKMMDKILLLSRKKIQPMLTTMSNQNRFQNKMVTSRPQVQLQQLSTRTKEIRLNSKR